MVDDRNTLAMDHQYIEDQHVADRYLDRTLAAAERLAFEKHFVDCAECLDRLALAEMFRDTPRWSRDTGKFGILDPAPVAAEETVAAAKPSLRSALGKLRQANTQTLEIVAIFATAAVLFVSIPAAYFLWQYASERRADQGPAAALIVLHRDREVAVTIGPKAHPLVFMLDVDTQAGVEQRVVLRSGGKVLWNGGTLVELHAAPAILIPSRVLPRGSAELRVESKQASGEWRPAAEYPLSVTRLD